MECIDLLIKYNNKYIVKVWQCLLFKRRNATSLNAMKQNKCNSCIIHRKNKQLN